MNFLSDYYSSTILSKSDMMKRRNRKESFKFACINYQYLNNNGIIINVYIWTIIKKTIVI